jgi:GT2 family glycosyltransferase
MAALPFCDRPYVLMLNNDVEPLAHNPEWLEILLAEMRNPHVGIVGPKLLFPDGRIQSAGTEYDQSREELFYHAGYGLPDSPGYSERREPVAVTGACLLCRRELFSLDVSMALNYEDVAMCLQAKQKGYKIVYQPAATLVHYEARTKASDPEAKIKIAASKAAFLEKYAELLP